MFGSQALETAIGLAVMFFILATAASAVTESISRMMKKRAKDLEITLKEMLTPLAPQDRESRAQRKVRLAEADDFFGLFKATSVWQAAQAASGRSLLLRKNVGNSYLSAKSFADAVYEVVTSNVATKEILDRVPSLKKRLAVLQGEARRGMLDVKAGLESWFDETMSRAQGAYKRWASLVLLLVGLVFAIVGNASTTDVATDLWQNSATRSAVTEAASNIGDDPEDINDLASATDELEALQLPVGWDVEGADDERADNPIDFFQESSRNVVLFTTLGWLLTALMVMLGGPFWFDLVTRLVSLRSSGGKPPPAAEDNTSAMKIASGAPLGDRPQEGFTARERASLHRLGIPVGDQEADPPPPPG